MSTTTIYPRFIGVDSNGDYVWELPNGRWTWGDDPYQAATRGRTFTSDRYLEKYGPLEPLIIVEAGTGNGPVVRVKGHGTVHMPGVVEVTNPRDRLVRLGLVERTGETAEADKTAGAVRALQELLEVLDGWIEGQMGNHEALGHGQESKGQECWRTWSPGDIRRMVDDAARNLGIDWTPGWSGPREDKPL